jgi:predicted RNase H-like HicB family nuclease
MRYYYINVDEEDNIISSIDTFEEQNDMIQLVYEEYQQAQLYNKFNLQIREFSEPKQQITKEVSRMDQIEEAIGKISLEVAKISLLGGN